MTATPTIFQGTVVKSVEWVSEIMSDLTITDEHKGLRALRAGLHAIRDLLPPAEAVDLAAQLPMLIRGLFFEGWRLVEHPPHRRDVDTVIAAVRAGLGDDPTIRAEAALRATIRVLAWHVSGGELDEVAHVLPHKVAEVWADCLA